MDAQTAVKDIPSGIEVTLGRVVLRVVALSSWDCALSLCAEFYVWPG